MKRWPHWRAIVAVLLMGLLPLQGLAASLCPHALAADGVAAGADATPPCHGDMGAEEASMPADADTSACSSCLHCLLGTALTPWAPAPASPAAQRDAVSADPLPQADADRRTLERPPQKPG
jgi:hypothetical protein